MSDLDDIYGRLATASSTGALASGYREAEQRGMQLAVAARLELDRPLPLLAGAVPPTATVSVAIHVLHAIPSGARGDLPRELADTAARNAADALHRCHRALELDGMNRGYTAEEWLPVVYDTAGPLLRSAGGGQDPPTAVRLSQEAVSSLSRALVELHEDSSEAAAALTETLARLLALWIFLALVRGADHMSSS